MAGKKNYNRIKVVLAEQSKTNLWLAEQLGVSKTTVSRWCTNEMQPTVEGLFFIANKLKVDVRELLASNKSKVK
jgi:putative transcriptional regulator